MYVHQDDSGERVFSRYENGVLLFVGQISQVESAGDSNQAVIENRAEMLQRALFCRDTAPLNALQFSF